MKSLDEWLPRLEEALEGAYDEIIGGKATAADRRAKSISSIVKALKEVIDLHNEALVRAEDENVESVRARLRARLARIAQADRSGTIPEDADASGSADSLG